MTSIKTLDLNFLGREQAIGSYLIPYQEKGILIETGPGSTLEHLIEELGKYNLKPEDITDVFLTHIHLDHAGAAGWFARNGAKIYVHPVGVPHLVNPEKLLGSAKRIYGDRMDFLWGEFLAVPEMQLVGVEDLEIVAIGDLRIMAIHTPGHAEHHISWLIEDTCFSGDIGGVRMPGYEYVRMPMVPPELNFEKWKQSLNQLLNLKFRVIAPTHFGLYEDAKKHLYNALRMVEASEEWMEREINEWKSIETIRENYLAFIFDQARKAGIEEKVLEIYEIANPSWMGADGIWRYWKKTNLPE